MTYVFDIDNTLCYTNSSDYENSMPIEARIKKVNSLYDEGHIILLQTARGMGRSDNSQEFAIKTFYDFTKRQVTGWGIKHHGLFLGKAAGDIYVDDKGCKDQNFFTD
mgnify:CR=1 FL=1|tara:strand:- start:4662 stop:4982 length:321 start_codon:yes stop_codon:yes gene_type:complete